ncbi:protein FAR1-RELATED SEQUENCE 6 isoform X4 [Aegilops tauschii subsp. strangulata]|uniref:protein FAR1-RELATED SEQUENCE 6 isoform X4 n=1 Tax=Aegilops tauschii subsp. strangulata TaxID=200361 RepID=UPI001ABCD470|nr:protein FAR1-RELATED SEQUENCE 6 isoform X4 [Aegilops tauschii subsp. strangulata]XP_044376590.1 protein FAR1-RELATED SEQUENCE 6-like isoform X3 [Triticum aestivum]
MEPDLTLDEVAEQNRSAPDAEDEDAFVVEEIGDSSDDRQAEPTVMLEPKKGMMFSSEDDAVRFYKAYARKKGFGVIRRTTRHGEDKMLTYFTLACNRQGKAQYSAKNSFKPNPSTRMQCPAKSNFSRRGENFCITTVTLEHNHPISPSKARFLRCHKKVDLHSKRRLELNDQAGACMNKNFGSPVMEAGNLEFGEKEYTNYLQEKRSLKLGAGDAHALYQYFLHMQSKDPAFFHVMDVAEDGRLRNVFWADARSRAAYESYWDVITFDTTYLTNKYTIPLATFVGVNHHGESVLLGCGLLSNEDTETFVWLFKSWLCCMSCKPPNAIITDQCKPMQNAIEEVFPQARHRWCTCHIMKKIPEKLNGYEKIKSTLSNVVYDSLTKHGFDKTWVEMINKYDLQDNEWLAELYDNKNRWVPAYVKDTFWAGMSSTKRSESVNAFFDGYVNARTTLKQFVEQYENALRDKVEKENKADSKSFQQQIPCITHYDFERQFQAAYTTAKFKEFQDQLRGKIYCYPTHLNREGSIFTFGVREDSKIFCEGEDGKGKEKRVILEFIVLFNQGECDVQCMCRLFEFRGILCSHIISVLALMEITDVPSRYILQRWRKDIKRKHTFIRCSYDDMIDTQVVQRYDNLCKRSRELAENGAESDALHDLVMDGLNELQSKIDAYRARSSSFKEKGIESGSSGQKIESKEAAGTSGKGPSSLTYMTRLGCTGWFLCQS